MYGIREISFIKKTSSLLFFWPHLCVVGGMNVNVNFSRAQFVFVFSFLVPERVCVVLFIHYSPSTICTGAGCWAKYYPCSSRTQIIFLRVGVKLRHLMMLLSKLKKLNTNIIETIFSL